MPDLC